MAWAASDVTLHLEGNAPVTRTQLSYHCDSNGVSMGLPAGAFTVQYLNSGANHLALLPLHGETMIFAGVPSASGARYAAGSYIWWEAGARGVTLALDGLSGKMETTCQAQGRQ